MKEYLVIDFGGTLAKYSVMTDEAQVLMSGEAEAPLHVREAFLDFIAELYRKVSADHDIQGVAISMPGVIEEERGYVRTAGAYLALYGMDLAAEMKKRIPVPVTAENDGKCGALAEVWHGNLSECKDGVVVILGTGVAGGMIKDRRLHKGKDLYAGEFSFILMDEDDLTLTGSCMWKCAVSVLLLDAAQALGIDVHKLANYALLSNFVKVEDRQLSALNDDPRFAAEFTGYSFFQLLDEGNPIAAQVYERYTRNLARLCWNLKALYAPEKILFGGGITRQPRLIRDINAQFDKIEAGFNGLMKFPGEIALCKYGNEANQYGALYHHLTVTGK